LNVEGRVFSGAHLDCPFRRAKEESARLKERTPVVLVDFHAEATSEKAAMAWYLDGHVSCVMGTHTHVQTADAQVLPGGTCFITDVGMTGPSHSVIGMKRELVLERFLTQLPVRFEVARGPRQFCAITISVDERTGRGEGIESIFIRDEGTL